VASICHDVGHDRFGHDDLKGVNPFGILFKSESVMETRHCQIAIGIISKDESDVFAALESDKHEAIWSLIIRLILATDLARHFEMVSELNALVEDLRWSMDDPEHRAMLLQMLLKCGDLSDVARLFDIAVKGTGQVGEEFFRQGDLVLMEGVEYVEGQNDREHVDRNKSRIPFVASVCLPLFRAVTRVVPALQCSIDQIESNMRTWRIKALIGFEE